MDYSQYHFSGILVEIPILEIVGNKAKMRISKRVLQENKARQSLQNSG